MKKYFNICLNLSADDDCFLNSYLLRHPLPELDPLVSGLLIGALRQQDPSGREAPGETSGEEPPLSERGS